MHCQRETCRRVIQRKGDYLFGLKENQPSLLEDVRLFFDTADEKVAKRQLLALFRNDRFIEWLLTVLFECFKIDVSYMTEDEYASCLDDVFNKLEYRLIPKELLTGEKFMEKSVNIGDQISQVIGIYYPYRMDNYVRPHRTLKNQTPCQTEEKALNCKA